MITIICDCGQRFQPDDDWDADCPNCGQPYEGIRGVWYLDPVYGNGCDAAKVEDCDD